MSTPHPPLGLPLGRPLRISLINPNTTVSMTEKAVLAAQAVAAPGTEITGYTSENGPAAIQGAEDGDASLPGLYAAVRRAVAKGTDGIIIACFDDTGLEEVRRISGLPVLGIGEAGYRMAAMVAPRFSVVTTLSVSVPVLSANIAAYGLEPACARVRASEVPVLELEVEGSPARAMISAEIGRAVAEDSVGAIVLGCAGMADLAEALAVEHGLPVIDGVAASVKLLESCHTLNLAPTLSEPPAFRASGNGEATVNKKEFLKI
jgi:allantoin racemase